MAKGSSSDVGTEVVDGAELRTLELEPGQVLVVGEHEIVVTAVEGGKVKLGVPDELAGEFELDPPDEAFAGDALAEDDEDQLREAA